MKHHLYKLGLLFPLALLFLFCSCSVSNSSKTAYKFISHDSLKTGGGSSIEMTPADVMPEYPAGIPALLKFISDKVNYPLQAMKDRVEGKVMVSFVVEKDGSLSTFEVIKSVSPEIDLEAVRVAKMMDNWIPGKKDGKVVRVRMVLPFMFSLQ